MYNPFVLGQKHTWKHGNTNLRKRYETTDDLGLLMMIQGWSECPVTPESVGEELFDDATFFVGRDESYIREFVRGALCG
jgi:hypothetical protein